MLLTPPIDIIIEKTSYSLCEETQGNRRFFTLATTKMCSLFFESFYNSVCFRSKYTNPTILWFFYLDVNFFSFHFLD